MPGPVSMHDSKRATQVTLKAVTLLSGVLTIVFLISFFFSDRGIAELQVARHRVNELQSEIKRLEIENARLRREIESARNSTFAIEKIAREDLGLSRKGVVFYMLPATGCGGATGFSPSTAAPRRAEAHRSTYTRARCAVSTRFTATAELPWTKMS
jgi:cell division protein FtsB